MLIATPGLRPVRHRRNDPGDVFQPETRFAAPSDRQNVAGGPPETGLSLLRKPLPQRRNEERHGIRKGNVRGIAPTEPDDRNNHPMDERKIIHIDMDAFYASVEQRDNPQYRGKPVVVGRPEGRGVIAAASYEARRYGIRSAMPSLRARQLCPELIFIPGRMEIYKEVSARIHRIFHEFTDLVEPIAYDEAFLDVTRNKAGIALGVDVARAIKRRIREEVSLVASAGVSYNKFLAKVASDYRKPDGLCTIHPDRAEAFIARLPIEAFWGVGRVTGRRMHELGIHTGADLRACSQDFLTERFGKAGLHYYEFARGIDRRPVEPSRIRTSVGCEETFARDLTTLEEMTEALYGLSARLNRRLDRTGFRGHTLTLKIKYANFRQQTRSRSLKDELGASSDIFPLGETLLRESGAAGHPVRLLGLSLSTPAADNPAEPHEVYRQLELDF